jgi:hypothetical protein
MKGRRSVLPKREEAEPPADIPLNPILQAQQLQGAVHIPGEAQTQEETQIPADGL